MDSLGKAERLIPTRFANCAGPGWSSVVAGNYWPGPITAMRIFRFVLQSVPVTSSKETTCESPSSKRLKKASATHRSTNITSARAIAAGLLLILLAAVSPVLAASCEGLQGMKVTMAEVVTGCAEHVEKGAVPAGGRGAIVPPLLIIAFVASGQRYRPALTPKIGVELGGCLIRQRSGTANFSALAMVGICRHDCGGRSQNRGQSASPTRRPTPTWARRVATQAGRANRK